MLNYIIIMSSKQKFISLNSDGSFTITELAREILWSSNIPIWGRILRLLQVKSCNLNQIIEVLAIDEDKIIHEIEQLRKNQLVLMSPQRQEEKLSKIYEILPEGIQEIDKTDTQGFNKSNFRKVTLNGGIIEIINQIQNEIQKSNITEHDKNKIIEKVKDLKNRLEI